MGGSVRYPHPAHGLAALAITVIALPIAATPANAATTRAEYVAQVDQVCGSFTPQFTKLSRSLKKLVGKSNEVVTESDAQEKRRLNRIFRGLGRFVGKEAKVLGAMTEQVALVPPAPGDEAAVAQWIAGLRQFVSLQAQSAPAFKHRRLGRAAELSQQSLAALNSGGAAVKDWGISTCLVTIDVSVSTTYG
jgi:hypothetical protein